MGTEYLRQREIQNAYEQSLKARALVLPTADADVRIALRAKGEPQTFFGEGPFERRERLRVAVQLKGPLEGALGSATTHSVEAGTVKADETFYTEGPAELRSMRVRLAESSIPVAYNFNLADGSSEPARKERAAPADWSRVECMWSRTGDSRPLMAGAISSDGAWFAAGGLSNVVNVWRTDDIETAQSCKFRVGLRTHGLTWHPQRPLVATADGSGDIYLLQVSDPEAAPVTDDLAMAEQDASTATTANVACRLVHKLQGHECRANKVDFNPLGGACLASTSADETWRYWDVERQKEILLQEGHCRAVYAVRHHPHGSLIATTDLTGLIKIWDIRTGKNIANMSEHMQPCTSVDWDPARPHMFISSSGDKMLRLWDLRKPKSGSVDKVAGHKNLVGEVRYHGNVFISSSHDATARVWNARDLRCIKVLVGHEGYVLQTSVHPSGKSLYSVSYDRTVKFWELQ